MDAVDKIIREITSLNEGIDALVYARYTPEGAKTHSRLEDAQKQLSAMIRDLEEIRQWTR
jgi:hypothetical protein